jgi:hypothetical protein
MPARICGDELSGVRTALTRTGSSSHATLSPTWRASSSFDPLPQLPEGDEDLAAVMQRRIHDSTQSADQLRARACELRSQADECVDICRYSRRLLGAR